MDIYQKTFAKFETPLSDAETAAETQKILQPHEKENFTPEVLRFLHGCIDLTSLSALDTKDSIWKLVQSVNDFEGTQPGIPNVAALCSYPVFTETIRQNLLAQDVKIAAVTGGFPASQTFAEVKIAETALTVLQGADEIDTVLNLGLFLEKSYQELAEELNEIKASARDGVILKIILETGALKSARQIHEAAIFAIYAGADFLKTSTGKEFPGATPEAAYTMCQVIKAYHAQTGGKIGLKVSGGIRTAADAVKYYTIVQQVLGDAWLDKQYFRIGASSLSADILRELSFL